MDRDTVRMLVKSAARICSQEQNEKRAASPTGAAFLGPEGTYAEGAVMPSTDPADVIRKHDANALRKYRETGAVNNPPLPTALPTSSWWDLPISMALIAKNRDPVPRHKQTPASAFAHYYANAGGLANAAQKAMEYNQAGNSPANAPRLDLSPENLLRPRVVHSMRLLDDMGGFSSPLGPNVSVLPPVYGNNYQRTNAHELTHQVQPGYSGKSVTDPNFGDIFSYMSPAPWALRPMELDAYAASPIKRLYAQMTGKLVDSPEEAEKAFNWMRQLRNDIVSFDDGYVDDGIKYLNANNIRPSTVFNQQLAEAVGNFDREFEAEREFQRTAPAILKPSEHTLFHHGPAENAQPYSRWFTPAGVIDPYGIIARRFSSNIEDAARRAAVLERYKDVPVDAMPTFMDILLDSQIFDEMRDKDRTDEERKAMREYIIKRMPGIVSTQPDLVDKVASGDYSTMENQYPALKQAAQQFCSADQIEKRAASPTGAAFLGPEGTYAEGAAMPSTDPADVTRKHDANALRKYRETRAVNNPPLPTALPSIRHGQLPWQVKAHTAYSPQIPRHKQTPASAFANYYENAGGLANAARKAMEYNQAGNAPTNAPELDLSDENLLKPRTVYRTSLTNPEVSGMSFDGGNIVIKPPVRGFLSRKIAEHELTHQLQKQRSIESVTNPNRVGRSWTPAKWALRPEELDAYAASPIKRLYAQMTGKLVDSPEEAEKALNWMKQLRDDIEFFPDNFEMQENRKTPSMQYLNANNIRPSTLFNQQLAEAVGNFDREFEATREFQRTAPLFRAFSSNIEDAVRRGAILERYKDVPVDAIPMFIDIMHGSSILGEMIDKDRTDEERKAMREYIIKRMPGIVSNQQSTTEKKAGWLEKESADYPALKQSAALPWRDRAEVYATNPEGKIFGGIWDNDKSFAVPGGGVDPGEDPEQAAIRELFEEAGMRAANPRRLPVRPVTNPWKEVPAGKEGYRGSRTHFVLADLLSDKPEEGALDNWGAAHRGLYAIADALKQMQGKTPQAPNVHAARLKVLQYLADQAAKSKEPEDKPAEKKAGWLDNLRAWSPTAKAGLLGAGAGGLAGGLGGWLMGSGGSREPISKEIAYKLFSANVPQEIIYKLLNPDESDELTADEVAALKQGGFDYDDIAPLSGGMGSTVTGALLGAGLGGLGGVALQELPRLYGGFQAPLAGAAKAKSWIPGFMQNWWGAEDLTDRAAEVGAAAGVDAWKGMSRDDQYKAVEEHMPIPLPATMFDRGLDMFATEPPKPDSPPTT